MNEEVNLGEIEKKAYTSYHQDGLLDIFIGVYILSFGLGILLGKTMGFSFSAILPGMLIAVMLPIWITAKRQITVPRIGFVKFKPGGTPKVVGIFIGTIVLGLGMLAAFAFIGTQNGPPLWMETLISYGMVIIGLAGAAISGLFGYITGLKRLYAYSLLILGLFASGYFIGIPTEYLLLTIGLAILISGCFILMRFVRNYPLPKGERTDAGSFSKY